MKIVRTDGIFGWRVQQRILGTYNCLYVYNCCVDIVTSLFVP